MLQSVSQPSQVLAMFPKVSASLLGFTEAAYELTDGSSSRQSPPAVTWACVPTDGPFPAASTASAGAADVPL